MFVKMESRHFRTTGNLFTALKHKLPKEDREIHHLIASETSNDLPCFEFLSFFLSSATRTAAIN
jgi:hypothetical protein